MEIFLQLREQLAPQRKQIGGLFQTFNITDEQAQDLEEGSFLDKLRFGGKMSKQALGLPGVMGQFFEARNQGLLDTGMGFGEYTYIYVLSFYSFLGHSPSEGIDDLEIETDGGATIRVEAPDTTRSSFSSGRLSRRVYGDLLGMLQNLLASLPEESANGASGDWSRIVSAEIEAMNQDRRRVPWQDGLPEAIAASLEPYRERLEATYHPAANEFELLRNKKKGLSIQAE